jgi:hypothetical protein
MEIDPSWFADGIHQLRVVAEADNAIAACSTVTSEFRTGVGTPCQIQSTSNDCELGETLQISAKAPGAERIAILLHNDVLGVIDASEGVIAVDSKQLGLGGSRIKAIAYPGDGKEAGGLRKPVQSRWLSIHVRRPQRWPPATTGQPPATEQGLKIDWNDGTSSVVESTAKSGWLSETKHDAGSKFQSTAYFEAAVSGLYQMQVRTNGPLDIQWNHESILSIKADDEFDRWHYVLLPLSSGQHLLRFAGTTTQRPQLSIRAGLRGCQSLDGRFRYAK